DADQLPPVGPGAPFHDLVAHGAALGVPCVRLTTVQRQAEASGIVRAAHRVRQGQAPEWAPDCRLVTCERAEDVPAAVLGVCRDLRLDPARSQVLAPQWKGPAGVAALNDYLEA